MSRTEKGKKSPGYEHWGKRPNSMSPPGKISKQITIRKERAAARALEKKAKRERD